MAQTSSVATSSGTLGLSMSASDAFELKQGYLLHTAQCLQNRKKTLDSNTVSVVEQSDSHRALTGFFVVNSGYGGESTAALAADRMYKIVQEQPEFMSDDDAKLSNSMGDAILELQQEVYEHWRVTNKMDGSHSTCVLVRGGLAVCANAGDGMAVISRSGGEVCALTLPAPRLEQLVQPSVTAFELEDEDEFILIGCPSLWAKLDVIQVTKLVRATLHKYKDPKYALKHLMSLAQRSGAPGNLSAVLIILNAQRAFDQDAHDLPALIARLKVSRNGSQSSKSATDGRSETSSMSSGFSSGSKTKKQGLLGRLTRQPSRPNKSGSSASNAPKR
eukprot:CAMPEP_0185848096 /NCGR_PEP_ID=MMETSP1354-20130828/3099_1 /TAXON_ID=708628 /ORGANISM="Erythrolobus madagascarensis, Strain CCMP3276" /LENGTH=331 /DNA_ID=CAMNT_0028548449 /DNA_START=196 /DNA_END=1191 /DNA_ORIENTATION=-